VHVGLNGTPSVSTVPRDLGAFWQCGQTREHLWLFDCVSYSSRTSALWGPLKYGYRSRIVLVGSE
jgi:hypothetical protein